MARTGAASSSGGGLPSARSEDRPKNNLDYRITLEPSACRNADVNESHDLASDERTKLVETAL